MKKSLKAVWLGVWAAVFVGVIVGFAFLTSYIRSWDRALAGYLGYIGHKEITSEELVVKQRDAVAEIVREGCVLLKNDNDALPMEKGGKVSVFGQTAQMWMTKEKLTNTKDTVFLESLESAGLEVNGDLRKFYKQSSHTDWGIGANLGDGGIAGTWKIDEVPQSEYNDALKAAYENYSDAAIVVITRGGSEGGDLPRDMERFGGKKGQTYMELSDNEKDLLKAIKSAGCFKRTVVVLHTANAMQMDFADDPEYGIDAVLWVSGTGLEGVTEVGKYFTGDVNPSGKNVDTYVYDNFSAPAMQNFGDYRFTKNGELIKVTTTTTGGTYSYVNYGEGIYMGYKYYETRYADSVTKAENVGNYDYEKTVYRPFGYGKSYTDFTLADFETERDGDKIAASVKVTNTGSRAGKEVVQFYYSAPYTAGGVEKSVVELIDFGKTSNLEPGGSETVTVEIDLNDMASYDSSESKQCYVLDGGDYYITAATDAHAATNNILAAKGFTDGLAIIDGVKVRADNVARISVEAKDIKKTASGGDIANRFKDDAELADAAYLSRSNWAVLDGFDRSTMLGGVAYATSTKALGTNPDNKAVCSNTTDAAGTVGLHEVNDSAYRLLTGEGWEYAGNPKAIDDPSWENVEYGSKASSYTLKDMVGVEYGDGKWDILLSQMSQIEQLDQFGRSGWGSAAVESVGKNETHYLDGPQGMIDYISGKPGYQFQDENMLGATWNKELSYKEGDLITQEFAMKGASIWWSPALNLHRTPFSGRNFEYFSEDGVHSGVMGTEWVKAANKNKVGAQLKHFFMNDQETNRGANGRIAVYATEQSMRELYGKPFQMCVENAYVAGVMNSMARVGSVCAPLSYSTCTGLLREEWGMKGAVITDAQSLQPMEAEQALAAGCDMVCSMSETKLNASTLEKAGAKAMLKEANKNIMYTVTNSIAVDVAYATGFPVYVLLLIFLWIFVVVYLLYGTGEILLKVFPEQKIISNKAKWITRFVLWGIAAAAIITFVSVFFACWFEDLLFALQTAV